MTIHKIAVIPGDGIGKEVIAEGVKVLQEVGGISLIEAVCKIAGEHIAGCRMKIFLDIND